MSHSATGNPHSILVVDDNPTNLSVIVEALSTEGHKILTSRDGADAIRKAQRALPDLILLDVMMPGMDGFETCRKLKADARLAETPVIFLTALESEEDKVKGFEAGGVDYVTKPIQIGEVHARVRNHLRLRDLARMLTESNEELRRANEELRRANADKDKFLSIMAHDLRSPFVFLIGMADLLAQSGASMPPEEVAESGRHLFRAAKNASELLENLLSWSRMRMGRMECVPVELSVAHAAERCVEHMRAAAAAKDVALECAVPASLRASADPAMVETILRNLVSNALKFTPKGGRVTVRGRPAEGGAVEVGVADTGVGIKPEDKAKLFRVDTIHTTPGTAKEKGSGLGLILCQEMVERCGGRIWVESEPGSGTTVFFTLPPCAG